MTRLFTIGHTKKPLRRFIELLRDAGVDAIVDIRRHNTSQLAGFAKRDDLDFLLREGFGIGYEHHPGLAPTEDVLLRYREDRDWPAFEAAYTARVRDEDLAARALAVLARYERPCLLCAEDEARRCHRRLLAEAVAARAEGLEVTHLR